MTPHPNADATPVAAEWDFQLTLTELCAACGCGSALIEQLVAEGVLTPLEPAPAGWRFGAAALARTRTAVRLTQDLELNPPGVALALELLDEIAALRSRLARLGP